MKLMIGTLLFGLAFATPTFDRVPSITLNQNRDSAGAPSISIAFPDGYNDNMILNKLDDEDVEENECIFVAFSVLFPWPLWTALGTYAILNLSLIASATYK